MRYQIAKWEDYNPRNDYKSLPWVRMQADILFEDKLFGLGPDQKWLWPCILGLAAKANKGGVVELDVDYLAHHSGVAPERVEAALAKFVAKGLLTEAPNLCMERQDVRETYVPRTDDVREPIVTRTDDDLSTAVPRSLRNGTERNDTEVPSTPRSPADAGRRGSKKRITRSQADCAFTELVAFARNRAGLESLSPLAAAVLFWRFTSSDEFRARYRKAALSERGATFFEREIQRSARNYAKAVSQGAAPPPAGIVGQRATGASVATAEYLAEPGRPPPEPVFREATYEPAEDWPFQVLDAGDEQPEASP